MLLLIIASGGVYVSVSGDNGASVAGFMDNKAFLMEVVLNHFADRDSQIQQVTSVDMPWGSDSIHPSRLVR